MSLAQNRYLTLTLVVRVGGLWLTQRLVPPAPPPPIPSLIDCKHKRHHHHHHHHHRYRGTNNEMGEKCATRGLGAGEGNEGMMNE
ncbi:hypothetical protein DFJ77DRAFT_87132 [Powellomyces hirtus]|nr:hypothetical protein DFJ77DRAFT_87132 [Powellomyces hirtus]